MSRRVSKQKDTKWRPNSKGEGYNQWVPIIGAKSIGFIRTISVRGKRRSFSPSLPAPGQPLIRMRFSWRSFAFLWPATASRRNRWRFSSDSPSPISKASSNVLSLSPRGDCPMIASYTETKSSRHLRRTISTRSMNLLSSILLPQEISDIYVQLFLWIWSNFTFHVYEIFWQMEKEEQYVRGTTRMRSMNLLSKIIPYVLQEISTNDKLYSSWMEFYEPTPWIERYL